MKNSSPTMKDVAREAGVSLGTVSKVVNNIPVGESYKRRVNEAIQKLNYQVNNYAQGMRTNKTYCVAFLVPNTTNPYFALLTDYINKALLRRNYRMLLCTTESEEDELEQRYITMAQQNKVDGIIGLIYTHELIIPDDIPFISIDRNMGSNIPCISSDNFAGGQLAAEKLSDLGCKNVLFLRMGSSLDNEPNKRKAGFENGCLSRNLKYEMLILDDTDPMDLFDSFLYEHVINGTFEYDGIFCVTDKIAYYIMDVLHTLNIRVPEDVQIIGYDGLHILGDGELVCSTIVQPVQEIAELSVDILLQENQSSKPPLICLPVSYEYGGTTLDGPVK